MDKGKKIIFQTADKETVEEYSHIFQRSVFLKGVLDDYPNDTKLNLEQITKPQFLKIIEYLKHYENVDPPKIERPLKSLDFKQCVNEWDYNYINLPQQEVFEIINIANYLDIEPLLELASAKIASIIKTLDNDEIRTSFDIPIEPMKGEEEYIMNENGWLFK